MTHRNLQALVGELEVHIGRGAQAWQASFAIPQQATGVVILVVAAAERKLLGLGMVEVLSQSGLASLLCVCPFLAEALEGDTGPHEDQAWMQQMASVGTWLSENLMGRNLPLGILGVGKAAVYAADAATQLGSSLQGLVLALAGPEIAELDLDAVRAPTLFIADADNALDVDFDEAMAMSLRADSCVVPVKAHVAPALLPAQWFLRQFSKFLTFGGESKASEAPLRLLGTCLQVFGMGME